MNEDDGVTAVCDDGITTGAEDGSYMKAEEVLEIYLFELYSIT